MFILKLKHWQVFIGICVAIILSDFSVEGNESLSRLLNVAGLSLWMAWIFLTGNSLYHYLPHKIQVNYTLYLVNSFVWIGSYLTIMIISDGNGMTFEGVAAIPAFYVLYAFLHFLAFPAKMLVSIEKNKEASFGEYIGTFFLILFVPIGIWIIQPRINKIVQGDLNQVDT